LVRGGEVKAPAIPVPPPKSQMQPVALIADQLIVTVPRYSMDVEVAVRVITGGSGSFTQAVKMPVIRSIENQIPKEFLMFRNNY
jgi:hypothetical protein